jgi:putative methionine-R-sulfoxide reductase with GAF domain
MSSIAKDVELIVNRGGDVDDVLRAVVQTIVERGGARWAGILFAEGDDFVLGPQAGKPDEAGRLYVPVIYDGAQIGILVTDGARSIRMLERVAELVSTYVLLGWDTGGEAWSP